MFESAVRVSEAGRGGGERPRHRRRLHHRLRRRLAADGARRGPHRHSGAAGRRPVSSRAAGDHALRDACIAAAVARVSRADACRRPRRLSMASLTASPMPIGCSTRRWRSRSRSRALPAEAFALTKAQLREPALQRMKAGASTDVAVQSVWASAATLGAIRGYVARTFKKPSRSAIPSSAESRRIPVAQAFRPALAAGSPRGLRYETSLRAQEMRHRIRRGSARGHIARRQRDRGKADEHRGERRRVGALNPEQQPLHEARRRQCAGEAESHCPPGRPPAPAAESS